MGDVATFWMTSLRMGTTDHNIFLSWDFLIACAVRKNIIISTASWRSVQENAVEKTSALTTHRFQYLPRVMSCMYSEGNQGIIMAKITELGIH